MHVMRFLTALTGILQGKRASKKLTEIEKNVDDNWVFTVQDLIYATLWHEEKRDVQKLYLKGQV